MTPPSPCPFCGSAAEMASNETKSRSPDTWFVKCTECHARGPEQWSGEDDWCPPVVTAEKCQSNAIKDWNRRA